VANVRGQGLQISDFNPQPPQASGLPDVPRGGAPSADALAGVANTLSAQVGRLGDTLAEAEGTKAGKIAGADPNWRPSDDMTIKGRAFDKAASEVYLSKLASNFQGDALDLYQKNQNDPAAFKTAYDGLVNTYRRDHVFPEASGWFDAKAGDIANSLRTRVLNNWESDQKDRANASLVTDLGAADVSRARLLAIDPHDPAAERESFRIRDENVARLRASADAGNITQTAAAKLIMAEQNKAQNDVITARAATLGSADEIDAYRAKLRKDFAAGKLPGLQDFDTVDSSLATMSKSKKTQADQALRDLDGKVSDFLDRFGKGLTPSSAEWLTLEQQGQKLGPAGAAAIDAARSKLILRQKIASLSVNDAESLVSSLEQSAKRATGAAEGANGIGLTNTIYGKSADAKGPGGFSAADHYAYLISKGATKNEALMLTGAAASESSFDPTVTHDGGKGYGLYGHNLGRLDMRGKGWQEQASAALAELRSRPEGAAVNTAKTADDLAVAQMHFEQPMDYTQSNPKGGLNYTGRLNTIRNFGGLAGGSAGGGIDKVSAGILEDARAAVAAKRSLIGQDPALAAEREGIVPQASTVDFSAAPDAVSAQMRARVTQAEAIGTAYQRPPQYIRPDEKPAMQAVLRQGGDKALDLIDGVIRGSGARAPQVLAEIGGDAPELAHAGMVSLSTGDRGFARQVAEAIKARAVPGAKVPGVPAKDVEEAMRNVIGPALNGMDATERARTQAAASAWSEQELIRRNLEAGDAKAKDVLEEGIKRARGMSVDHTGAAFGGVADVPIGRAGLFGRDTVKVQVPADVKTDKMGDVFAQIKNLDLENLANPPMAKGGRVMTADELRRATPIFGPGGYRFGVADKVSGKIEPIVAKDGSAFVLPWSEIAPTLRSRAPYAFR